MMYRYRKSWPERQRQNQLRYRRSAELAAHADYEHRLWMSGDSRGLYGHYPPAM